MRKRWKRVEESQGGETIVYEWSRYNSDVGMNCISTLDLMPSLREKEPSICVKWEQSFANNPMPFVGSEVH